MALNVALYAPGGNRWAMTERGRAALSRQPDMLEIGPSRLVWDDDGLTVDFDEIAVPRPPAEWWPVRLCSRVRIPFQMSPPGLTTTRRPLDAAKRHWWWPIAPVADIEVTSRDGSVPAWSGHGYFDSNWGSEPLEAGFDRWDWARARTAGGGAVILYDSCCADGSDPRFALRFGADGSATEMPLPSSVSLGRGFWQVERRIPADPGTRPRLCRAFEDSPFYLRGLVETEVNGERAVFVHESLDGRRFANPIVKAMLPFRMPRRAGRSI